MEWLVLLAVVWLAAKYFGRKKNIDDLVIRVSVSTDEPNTHEASAIDDGKPPKDNWEAFPFFAARCLPAKGRYRIRYTDQAGQKTERDIIIKRAYESGSEYAIDAHCLMRGAHRHFVDNRIEHGIDLETGEVVESVARHAISQFNDSAAGQAVQALDREWIASDILSFVCRADDRMTKPERAIVADYFKRRCPDLKHDDEALDKAIKTLGEPDHHRFKELLAQLKTAGDFDRLDDLLDCAKRIVATQKTIAPMEKAALDTIESYATR